MSTTDFGRAHHQLLIARARRLERMGLSGIARGDTIDWTIGRGRGGPSL